MSTPTVEFVVPDGYRGRFVLFVDPINGVALRQRDGVVTIDIPVSGVLRIKDDSILARWHTPKARYQDGTPILYEPNGKAKPGEAMLLGAGSSEVDEDGTRIHWNYVGTRADYDQGIGITAVEEECAKQIKEYRDQSE